jgi:hypothetical protein
MLREPNPPPPFKGEREEPAKREREVGGAAKRINRPPHPALPRPLAAGGESRQLGVTIGTISQRLP